MRLPSNYKYAEVMRFLVRRFKPEETFTAHDIGRDFALPKGALQHLRGLALLRRVDRIMIRTKHGKSRGGNRLVNVYVIPVGTHEYITKRFENDDN